MLYPLATIHALQGDGRADDNNDNSSTLLMFTVHFGLYILIVVPRYVTQ